jgi:putative PIN family toxin of toxin-antitoxin system
VTNRPRYVLDTNVIASALLFPDSKPGQAFFQARKRGEILLSAKAIEEIVEVIRRPKFDRYVLAEERDRFLATLIRESRFIEPTETICECRDPKDDKWLGPAVGGAAERLISGDDDLLQMKRFRDIPIVAPSQFLESLSEYA